MKLRRDEKTNNAQKLDSARTIKEAIALYSSSLNDGKTLHEIEPAHFIAEQKPCEPHLCQDLFSAVTEDRKSLSDDEHLATTPLSVVYLRLVNYLRTNSQRINRKDVHKMLVKYAKSGNQDGNVFLTLLDVIAGQLKLNC